MNDTLNEFAKVLQQNLGNRLTPELANGLLFALENALQSMLTRKQVADDGNSPPDA